LVSEAQSDLCRAPHALSSFWGPEHTSRIPLTQSASFAPAVRPIYLLLLFLSDYFSTSSTFLPCPPQPKKCWSASDLPLSGYLPILCTLQCITIGERSLPSYQARVKFAMMHVKGRLNDGSYSAPPPDTWAFILIILTTVKPLGWI
jgi:hypothetical protein